MKGFTSRLHQPKLCPWFTASITGFVICDPCRPSGSLWLGSHSAGVEPRTFKYLSEIFIPARDLQYFSRFHIRIGFVKRMKMMKSHWIQLGVGFCAAILPQCQPRICWKQIGTLWTSLFANKKNKVYGTKKGKSEKFVSLGISTRFWICQTLGRIKLTWLLFWNQ